MQTCLLATVVCQKHQHAGDFLDAQCSKWVLSCDRWCLPQTWHTVLTTTMCCNDPASSRSASSNTNAISYSRHAIWPPWLTVKTSSTVWPTVVSATSKDGSTAKSIFTHTLNCGERAWRLVSSSSIRMSSAETFANSRVICVLSAGFFKIAFATWYIGVTPVPPASIPAQH